MKEAKEDAYEVFWTKGIHLQEDMDGKMSKETVSSHRQR